ncbi:MAG: Crp/Fnr family transcriptional regulator [Geminicoccaceae bacterium]
MSTAGSTQQDRLHAASVLAQAGWLARQPAAFRDEVLRRSRVLAFARGQTVQRAGDTDQGLFGLAEGSASVLLDTSEIGSHAIHLARPGFWFGALPMVGMPKMVTVIATEPCKVLFLSQPEFQRIVDADPVGWQHLAILLAGQLTLAIRTVGDLLARDPVVRIVSRIVTLHDEHPPTDPRAPWPLPVSQAELAMMCNLSRKTVNQLLSQLGGAGALSSSYGRVIVHDLEALKRQAGSGIGP